MNDRLTAEQLAELRRLEQAATPGEWYVNGNYPKGKGWPARYVEAPDGCVCSTNSMTSDVELIAALRNAAKSLLAAAEREGRLREALSKIADATQRWMTGVGSYAGGETNAGFASRLKDIARAALEGGPK